MTDRSWYGCIKEFLCLSVCCMDKVHFNLCTRYSPLTRKLRVSAKIKWDREEKYQSLRKTLHWELYLQPLQSHSTNNHFMCHWLKCCHYTQRKQVKEWPSNIKSRNRGGKRLQYKVHAHIVRWCQANKNSKGSQVSGCADVRPIRWNPSSNPCGRPVTVGARTYRYVLFWPSIHCFDV